MTAGERDGGVTERVRHVLAALLDVPPERVVPGFGREQEPRWDSMTHLRIVSALEEALGVRFTMDDVGRMSGFVEICRIAESRKAAS